MYRKQNRLDRRSASPRLRAPGHRVLPLYKQSVLVAEHTVKAVTDRVGQAFLSSICFCAIS